MGASQLGEPCLQLLDGATRVVDGLQVEEEARGAVRRSLGAALYPCAASAVWAGVTMGARHAGACLRSIDTACAAC
jgi:hypothetical protein